MSVMKKLLIYISTVIILLVSSCTKDTELAKSIFIPDKDFQGLPAYSEWGLNTFGAYYDRELFVSNNNKVPAKIINTAGKTSFTLKGQLGAYEYYYSHYYYHFNNYPVMTMTFQLTGFSPQIYSDLTGLDKASFDLTKAESSVSVSIDTAKYAVKVISGTLEFKKAQNLIVDKRPSEVILSGTFEFQALFGSEPISISLGRFDVGIGPDNFYKY
jgi:hypothetical protein